MSWPANPEVIVLLNTIIDKYHKPRLEQAKIVVSFEDAKPFKQNRFNWGKTKKFNQDAKIWQAVPIDFCITVPTDVWAGVLDAKQREALLDLHLTRCSVEYVPAFQEVNGKKIPIKDEFGRVEFTNEMKLDKEGNIKWKLLPFCLDVVTQNVSRYGCWIEEIEDLKNAIKEKITT